MCEPPQMKPMKKIILPKKCLRTTNSKCMLNGTSWHRCTHVHYHWINWLCTSMHWMEDAEAGEIYQWQLPTQQWWTKDTVHIAPANNQQGKVHCIAPEEATRVRRQLKEYREIFRYIHVSHDFLNVLYSSKTVTLPIQTTPLTLPPLFLSSYLLTGIFLFHN